MDKQIDASALAEENLKFQGEWQQTHSEENGVANPPSEFGAEPFLSVSGNAFVVTHSDGSTLIKGVFAINPLHEPKTIDWSDTFGADAGKTFPAIYRFESDQLIFCAADDGQVRPKEFRTHHGQVLRVHRRVVK